MWFLGLTTPRHEYSMGASLPFPVIELNAARSMRDIKLCGSAQRCFRDIKDRKGTNLYDISLSFPLKLASHHQRLYDATFAITVMATLATRSMPLPSLYFAVDIFPLSACYGHLHLGASP